jgi:signal transduction histidine kinase
MTHQKYPNELVPVWNAFVRTVIFTLVSGLEAEVLERKRVERQLKQANDELQKQTVTLQSILRNISEATDRERRRLGEDLHDGLCQHLVSTAFATRKLATKLAEQSPAQAAEAAQIAELLSESIAQARDVARGLYIVPLEAGGLGAALDEFLAQMRGRNGVACDLIEKQQVPALDEAIGTNLFRIAQEAVTNAIKHGKPQRIIVTLSLNEKNIYLEIADDGTGISANSDATRGLGLRIMNQRARMIGGALKVLPRPGGGTLVTCNAPLQSNLAAEQGTDNG